MWAGWRVSARNAPARSSG